MSKAKKTEKKRMKRTSDLISRCELFNKLATITALPEANDLKAQIYAVIQSMDAKDTNVLSNIDIKIANGCMRDLERDADWLTNYAVNKKDGQKLINITVTINRARWLISELLGSAPSDCTNCECTDECSECQDAEHGCKDEPQTDCDHKCIQTEIGCERSSCSQEERKQC